MTIRDVAAYCGVSVSTVSRVLNGHPDVSSEVRARVLEAVGTLHYVPNASARDLVRPVGDAIGVVVRRADDPFFTPVIRSIERTLDGSGYTTVLHRVPAESDELKEAAGLAGAKRLRGLILLGGRFDHSAEEAEALDIPFVCCGFTNRFGTMDKARFSSVSISDLSEARRAVLMLTDRGHRKIAVLAESISDGSVSELRYRGYLQALGDAGIEPDRELAAETLDPGMASAYLRTRELIDRRPDVTAIFAVSDRFAVAAMKALSDGGRRVPEDCSVIAIDGIEMSLYTVPTLTTLVLPQEELGSRAAEQLLGILKQGREHRHIRLEAMLREGGTVRPLP